MRLRTSFFAAAACAALSLAGAGCAVPGTSTTAPKEITGPKPAVFDGLSPEQAAKKVAFVSANIIEVTQGFGGIGGAFARKIGFGGAEATRDVVIQSFAPAYTADISWRLSASVPKDPKDPKDPGVRITSGRLIGANLQSSHALYLPGYWSETQKSSFDTSLIWLSQDVYENLTHGDRRTVLDLGVLDPVLGRTFIGGTDIRSAVAKIQTVVNGTSTDPNLMEADADPSTYTLKINGADVTVQTRKARGFFGEIEFLDNQQNPLVLRVTMNPLALAAADATTGAGFLKNGLGYHVTELKDIQQ